MTSTVIGTDFTGGARLPNYVNGRLLAAEDLATSQSTLRARDALIGRAAGSGVVTGLWISSSATSLSVTPGLAITPSGQPVRLTAAKTLPLVSAIQVAGTTKAGFSCCNGSTSGTETSVGAGSYLLTVRPACEYQGQASLAEAPDSDAPAGCGAQWQVEGLRFVAIELPDLTSVGGQSMSTATRRNLLAQWCYGVDKLSQLGADPFNFALGYDGFDSLDSSDLTDCDVPLAVFHWDGQQIADLDNWSARRRITAPDPITVSWSATLGDRRASDGQARFLQFQDQLADVLSTAPQSSIYAGDVFGFLPPVGFVPLAPAAFESYLARLAEEQDQTDDMLHVVTGGDEKRLELIHHYVSGLAAQAGFEPRQFFGDFGRYGGLITWEEADLALQQSWHRDPVRVPALDGSDEGDTGVTYYFVLENVAKLLAEAEDSEQSSRQQSRLLRFKRGFHLVATSPAIYVVFIKNYLIMATRPPVEGSARKRVADG